MPRNPVTVLAERYIERQRQRGKAPSPSFFRLPGTGAAIANLTKREREAKGIPRATPPKEESKGGILMERKKATDKLSEPRSYAKGGMVKRTGMAKVHKGEKVMTKSQVKKMKNGKSC